MNQKIKNLAKILAHLGHSKESAEVGLFALGQENYRIQSGDNPWGLADGDSKYHQMIMDANPNVDWNKLQIGQEILLPSKPSYPNKGMQPANPAFEIIKHHEKLRLRAYNDGFGKMTIGYGHVLKDGESFSSISESKANSLLQSDAIEAGTAIQQLVFSKLNQNQFDGLTSLIFNIGRGNFARSTLLELLNAGDFQGASKAFSAFNKAGGEENAHLTQRRQAEAALFVS